LKERGFYPENAAAPGCCFKQTETGYCWGISRSGIVFFFFF